ncbi:MAG: phospholipase D family protein [Myxococcota bacterium]
MSQDFADPPRSIPLSLISGRGHYDEVIQAVLGAKISLWISTANLKALYVETLRGLGRRRGAANYHSIVSDLAALAERGVELRILHAREPSQAFLAELRRQKLGRRLVLRACPRVHLKTVIVDGRALYLGSANWTGAGLGAKGEGRRNFELGIWTEDEGVLDRVQALYDRIYRGQECGACRLREVCPKPLDGLPKKLKLPGTRRGSRRAAGRSKTPPAR